MENKGKIAVTAILVLMFLGCGHQEKNATNSLIQCDESSPPCALQLKEKAITKVWHEGSPYPLEDFIDFGSFGHLVQSQQDSTKVGNTYYLEIFKNRFFRDKYFGYEVIKKDKEWVLEPLGKTKELHLLGGTYMQIGTQVFWNSSLLKDADVASFVTVEAYQDKREFPIICGKDRNTLFYGEQPMTKELFELLVWEDKDGLRQYYYPTP